MPFCGYRKSQIEIVETVRSDVKGLFSIVKWILIPFLCPLFAEARLVGGWSPESLAREAEVLMVGEVVKTNLAGRVAKKDAHWNIPLLRMNAVIRRVWSFQVSDNGAGLSEP